MTEIERRPFPTRMAVLASSKYVFDQARGSTELTQRIICQRTMASGLEVLAINLGLLAYDFAATTMGAFEQLVERGEGVVPDEVTANRDAIIDLQIRRMQTAIFVAACIYGRHAHLTHSALQGPRYPGLDEVYNWGRMAGTEDLGLPQADHERLMPYLSERIHALRRGHSASASIPVVHFDEGVDMAERLIVANADNEVADFVAMVVMTYQAAILHARQHAGASIALSAVILEALVHELFFVYGLPNGSVARAHAHRPHTCAPLSRTALTKLGFGGMVEHLKVGGLLDAYLVQRIEDVRVARNDLMHRGTDARPTQSGSALTAVRDIFKLCTGEEFELNAAWSYRL